MNKEHKEEEEEEALFSSILSLVAFWDLGFLEIGISAFDFDLGSGVVKIFLRSFFLFSFFFTCLDTSNFVEIEKFINEININKGKN